MQTPYWPRGPLRISLLPPLCAQNTEAGLASAKARSGAMASNTRAARMMNGRMLSSRLARNRATRCEDSIRVYTAQSIVGIPSLRDAHAQASYDRPPDRPDAPAGAHGRPCGGL